MLGSRPKPRLAGDISALEHRTPYHLPRLGWQLAGKPVWPQAP
jgi:hypothetical protein